MGTLHHQSNRKYAPVTSSDVKLFIEDAIIYSKKFKIPVSDVLKAWEILEQKRANDFSSDDGDRWDEQISGIGTAIERVASALQEIADKTDQP